MEELRHKRLTIFEISEIIGFQENSIRSAIHRLKENGLVQESGYFKRRYKIWEIPNIPYDLANHDLFIPLSNLDTEILKTMLLPFVKRDITVKLTPEQADRVTKLFFDTYNEEGERIDGK